MSEDLTALPAAKVTKGKGKAQSFKRALDTNLDGVPNSPGMRKAIAKRAGNRTAKSTTLVVGELVHTGRPSKYTQDLADEICERVANGESLRKITRDEHIPEGRTVWRWLRENDIFRQQYALSKAETADALSEDIQEIADKTLRGEYDPLAARVAIDAYKWTASKLKPKKYGDKLDLTTDGKELPTPLLASISIEAPKADGSVQA